MRINDKKSHEIDLTLSLNVSSLHIVHLMEDLQIEKKTEVIVIISVGIISLTLSDQDMIDKIDVHNRVDKGTEITNGI